MLEVTALNLYFLSFYGSIYDNLYLREFLTYKLNKKLDHNLINIYNYVLFPLNNISTDHNLLSYNIE
jgi:hypothetical protein